jgi:hypothetical protein
VAGVVEIVSNKDSDRLMLTQAFLLHPDWGDNVDLGWKLKVIQN